MDGGSEHFGGIRGDREGKRFLGTEDMAVGPLWSVYLPEALEAIVRMMIAGARIGVDSAEEPPMSCRRMSSAVVV